MNYYSGSMAITMGTEKNRTRILCRSKPPPVPPRPQHLTPAKLIAKYSSMPDILNGWRRDTNPDLIKVNTLHYGYPCPKKESKKGRKCDVPSDKPKSRKFSCIPMRSNSKKKQRVECEKGDSQTSWYVEDVARATAMLSKCEISLNTSDGCRYRERKDWPEVRRRPKIRAPMSSLSGLPPLPKSLSDASLPWDTNKRVSPYTTLSSSSSSCGSTRSHIVHPKVPPPSPPHASPDSSSSSSSRARSTPPPPPPPRKPTSLDAKLAILRKEMYDLRQMDLSLLSQLWSLNEAIHEFRQLQECLSPDTTSSHSSDDEDYECYYSNVKASNNVNAHSTPKPFASSSSRSSSVTTSHSTTSNAHNQNLTASVGGMPNWVPSEHFPEPPPGYMPKSQLLHAARPQDPCWVIPMIVIVVGIAVTHYYLLKSPMNMPVVSMCHSGSSNRISSSTTDQGVKT